MRRVLTMVAPLGLAFIPLGMALGFLVVHAGLAWWWAPVFAGVIYAGSLEFWRGARVAGGGAVDEEGEEEEREEEVALT